MSDKLLPVSSLVNKQAIRRLIFDRLVLRRPALINKKTQVDKATFNLLEAEIRIMIDTELDRMSTVGKTIRLFQR